MKHEIRQMLDTGTAGAIVNTSSGAGVVPAPGQPHYTAAKHAVLGLTRCAASEYVKFGIRCNSILPGMVDTPMLTGGTGVLSERAAALLARVSPTGELLQPAQIAAVAVWLCSDSADAVNGQAIVADGGGIMR
jgi:NAD(P)-dependent dehydrogenase (short-subunit alcohol dehydrogenase family)